MTGLKLKATELSHSSKLKEPELCIRPEEFPFHRITVKTEDDEDESSVLHPEEKREETDETECGPEGCSSDPLTQLHSDTEDFDPSLVRPHTTGVRRKPLTCSWCAKDFMRSSELRRHVLIHTGQRPFTCPFCSQSFRRKSNLKRHIRVHTGEKPFACALCHETFAYKQSLEKHSCGDSSEQQASNGDQGRPHKCKQCGKGFTRVSNLDIHQLVHTQERKQKCSICDKAFKQKASLTRHLKIHHRIYPSAKAGVEKVRPQKCPDCGKGFSRKYDVRRHMRTHTRGESRACVRTVVKVST